MDNHIDEMSNRVNNQKIKVTDETFDTLIKTKLEKEKTPFSTGIYSKASPMIKPDFSSIEKREGEFTYKQKGSYKKPKSVVPESPMKSPNQKFFTPVKLQNKNLFGGNTGNLATCRKLNFIDGGLNNNLLDVETPFNDTFKTKGISLLEQLEEEDKNIPSNEVSPNIFSKRNMTNSSGSFLFERLGMSQDVVMEERESNLSRYDKKFDIEEYVTDNKFHKIETKFDKEFDVIRTLDAGAFGIVYQCINKNDNQIYAVKKSKKHSSIYDYDMTDKLIKDFYDMSSKEIIFSKFCISYKECWLEEEGRTHTLTENHLYVIQEFCKYGDLLDYLEKLEGIGFKFNENFYWDLIFEMLCSVHFVHLSDYIHFDIKPNNFLIDETGGIKLGDFGLTRKISDIKKDEDLNEGDSSYLAPEFFDDKEKLQMLTTSKVVTAKCDVFSLGLSILEILCKIELPQNGILWKKIRSENFEIPEEFLNNSNIKINENMIDLIKEMLTLSPDLRPDIKNIFENEKYLEINKRYKDLINMNYSRFLNPKLLFKNEENSPIAKRSNSFLNFD